jgi:hypothetical protein
MKKLSPAVLVCFYFFTSPVQAQNVCTQQFSGFTVHNNTAGISAADAQGIVADILNVMGLKGNFDVKEAKVSNAAAVIYNGKRYLLYNPVFIAALNDATGNDWASVSVLAHEIGHHLNGHTLSGGSEPARELEADEFSGYIMQRLGASLQEAETAMKLAADVNGTATHPGRTDRLLAIEQGWNRASDQLSADIEANENDSSGTVLQADTISAEQNTRVAELKEPGISIQKDDIIAIVYFDEDSTGQYYLMTDGSLVAVAENRLYRLGQLKEHNSNEFPFIIESKNERLYIDDSGAIIDRNRIVVGRIRKLS